MPDASWKGQEDGSIFSLLLIPTPAAPVLSIPFLPFQFLTWINIGSPLSVHTKIQQDKQFGKFPLTMPSLRFTNFVLASLWVWTDLLQAIGVIQNMFTDWMKDFKLQNNIWTKETMLFRLGLAANIYSLIISTYSFN